MGIIFKTEKRRIIPKWRSLDIAKNNGELRSTAKKAIPKSFELDLLNDQKKAFAKEKDLQHAGDLLGSAYVLGFENEFKEVAKFILSIETNEKSALATLAKQILEIVDDDKTGIKSLNQINQFQTKYSFDINKYKSYLKKEPRNPLAWIELGRLYSLINKKEKAKRCIDAALFLDGSNRFIVRSASRFYHHIEPDKEKALGIIKKSKFIDTDPWLMSAEIAYSSILGRFSTMAEKGINFLKNRSYDNFEITELASALGTFEFFNGKRKIAKKYFDQSLIQPNDNSIAQARWMSNEIQGLDVDVSQYHLPLAFEADAIASFENKAYDKALQNSMDWINDEPYSTRPVKLASYISSIFLKDNDNGIELLKEGLRANPDDLMLNNNLVYFLVRGNFMEEAIKIFQNKLYKKINDANDISKLTLTATAGLLLYRDGANEQGKELYQYAIKLAKATGNEYLVALATVNYANEEVRFVGNKSELASQMSYLNTYIKNHESSDIDIFYSEFLEEFNKTLVS
jgi:predicted Zn-dependent protease